MGKLLLRADGVLVDHWCPLDPPPPYQAPDRWDAPHVQVRFSDAIGVLLRLPLGRLRPVAFRNSWPAWAREWDVLMARCHDIESMNAEGLVSDELYGAYHQWHSDRTQMRRDPPTAKEIGAMEQAIEWPGRYLRDRDELARALNLCGLAQARGLSVQQVARGGKHKGVRSPTQWNQMALTAANTIAGGLRTNKIAVF